MSGFKDQLVQFNPYIPQIPVDDYVRVGMMKQEQYNRGVERTQQYIDSVAGLDVVKPEQKEYLTQRVGQLQGEVGKILSQDFSNQQIVNSVGSLTNKIAGDPIVQNAVLSTQKYKQGLGDMKEAKEKGTLSPSNEYVFQRKVQDWLSDGDVKSTFTGEYEPYTDTKKPILDAINALKPGANITDIPYETDTAGNYVLDSRGDRKIAYATLREKMEGVSDARIKQAIEASITPQMRRQFQIDGMYNYRGVDKVGLKKMATDSYNYKLDQVNDILQGLNVQLQANQNDARKKQLIQAQIDRYRLSAQDLQSQYKQDVQYLDKNPEEYKGDLHYQDEVAKYTLGYSWSKHSLTYENNPVFNGMMKDKEYNLNWNKFLETSQYHRDLLAEKRDEMSFKRDIEMMKLQMKYGKGAGSGLLNLDIPFAEGIGQEDLEKINLSTLQNTVTSMNDDLQGEKMKAIGMLPGGSDWLENVDGKARYKDQKSKDAAETALKTLKEAYDKDPSSVSPGLQNYFGNTASEQAVVQNYQATADKIMKDADDKFGLQHLTRGVSPLTFTTNNGQKYNFTPKEMLDLLEKEQKQDQKHPLKTFTLPNGNTTVQPRSKEEEEAYYSPFNDKEKALLQQRNNSGLDNNAENSFMSAFNKLHSTEAKNLLAQRDNYIQTEARRAYTQNQAEAFPIVAYKAADANRVKAAFVQILNDQKQRGVSNANPNFDEDDISKMINEKNARGTNYSLHAKPDGSFSVRFSNTSITDKPREMDITADQAARWFGSFVNEFKPYQVAINLSKYNGVGATTDVTGRGKESAYNIPQTQQLQNYSVKYHIEEPQNGQYQLKLYIYDKKGKQWLPERYVDLGGRLLNQQQITAAVNNLSDAEIDRVLGRQATGTFLPNSFKGIPGPDPFVNMQGISGSQGDEDQQDQSDEEDQE